MVYHCVELSSKSIHFPCFSFFTSSSSAPARLVQPTLSTSPSQSSSLTRSTISINIFSDVQDVSSLSMGLVWHCHIWFRHGTNNSNRFCDIHGKLLGLNRWQHHDYEQRIYHSLNHMSLKIAISLCPYTPTISRNVDIWLNTQEWALHSAHIDSPQETFDVVTAAIRSAVPTPSVGVFCGKRRILVWSSGTQTWTSTIVSTASFANSEILQTKVLITAGVEKLQNLAQATDE
ncbi:uncharacterized protein N7529_007450 [Penicillium soppii]|uniref:uncharacterized protein n=1 Tax=Penicillium soppii TaxID=69789 RepID=UPI0025470BFF|nr:uncharacterized protein N7529_007450 [Penicillium soppii]KAJ5860140.1 hypothetical protein N7529_007450 [Penicillium soppii]